MVSRLALGTVQFGLHYGINNQQGKTDRKEVGKILSYAIQQGISVLDTAHAYGNSEEVLGLNDLSSFKVISKLPACNVEEVEPLFEHSLVRLQIPRLYGYLFHNIESYYKAPGAYCKIQELQEKGKIVKIGFSLYKPEELETLWNKSLNFQLVQFPYNILDRRFEPYLMELRNKGVEIHVRSIFLQGLFFRNTQKLPEFFAGLLPKLQRLNRLCKDLNISKSELCLNFVVNNPLVDKAVIGVDSLRQLENNVKAVHQANHILSAMPVLMEMKEEKEDFILPTNWKL